MIQPFHDKENVDVNIMRSKDHIVDHLPLKVVGDAIKQQVEATPIKVLVEEEIEEEDNAMGVEIKLPVDDFLNNGVCVKKTLNVPSQFVLSAYSDKPAKKLASPYSPELNVMKYKVAAVGKKKASNSKGALQPVPHVLNFAHGPRQDTLKPTWDLKKAEGTSGQQPKKVPVLQQHKTGDKTTTTNEAAAAGATPAPVAAAAGVGADATAAAEMALVRSQVKTLKDANTDLTSALREAKLKCSRIDEISRINESITKMAHEMRADRDVKVRQVAELDAQLRKTAETVGTLQTQIESLESLNGNLCSEMVANQDMLETKSARLEELEKKLEQAQQFGSSSSSSNSPLKDELSVYSAKLQEKDAEVTTLRREIAHLMDRVAEEKRAAEVHRENLQVLEVKYEEARNRLDGSASERDEEAMELQSRLEAKGAALVQVECELTQMRRELAAKDEELMTLLHSSVQSGEIAAGKLAHSNERVLAAQAELRAAHDKIAALEATDASRVGELRNLRHVLTAEIKTLTEEKSELRASCTQYRISLESAKERLRALEVTMQAAGIPAAGTKSAPGTPGAAIMTTTATPGTTGTNTPDSMVTWDTIESSSSAGATTVAASVGASAAAASSSSLADKARIASLEEDLKNARDLLIAFSKSKDHKIANMEALLRALDVDIDHLDATNIYSSIDEDGEKTEAAAAAAQQRGGENSLVAKFLRSEERCKELLMELTNTQDQHEKAERTIRHLTDEFERSKLTLEKQLSSSSSSNGDLASKMCDMNEKVEHLMAYGLKLTEQLSTSKESEGRLMETVAAMKGQMDTLREQKSHLERQLSEATHKVDLLNTTDEIPPPNMDMNLGEDGGDNNKNGDGDDAESVVYDLQELRAQLKNKEYALEEVTAKYNEMSFQLEGAALTLEKAKQSKIKRYNKYIALQNEYKMVVSQVQRLMDENSELKNRHKTFVRTVEQTLVGGPEGKRGTTIALTTNNGSGVPMPMEMQSRQFNDNTWNVPTPISVNTDSTGASYHHHHQYNHSATAPATGSTQMSVITPSSAEMLIDAQNVDDTVNNKRGGGGLGGAAAFPDLRYEGGAEH